ncbi:ankyrin repeat-containing domain protein [Xylariaceae sp. FL0804]|nr:ankyrin repeat-containing domain protein [Xylariaceae sp. FL0804]
MTDQAHQRLDALAATQAAGQRTLEHQLSSTGTLAVGFNQSIENSTDQIAQGLDALATTTVAGQRTLEQQLSPNGGLAVGIQGSISSVASQETQHFRILLERMTEFGQQVSSIPVQVSRALAMASQTLPPQAKEEGGDNDDENDEGVATENASSDVLSIDTLFTSLCDPSCTCQCHHTSASRTWNWLRRFVGRLFFSYNHVPYLDPRPCNRAACRARSGSSIRFTYFFPAWLVSRALHVTAALETITGPGADLHFRVPRVIPDEHPVWGAMSSISHLQLMLTNKILYPTDINSFGQSLLSFSIREAPFNSSFLLTAGADPHFEDALGLSPVAFVWQWHFLGRRINGLEQFLDRDFFSGKRPPNPFHRAVYKRDIPALQAALRLTVAGIEDLDAFGCAPLHWAAMHADYEACKLLLENGANCNLRNCMTGDTPLIVLSMEPNISRPLFDLFVEYGADQRVRGLNNDTALHWAATQASDMTFFLLGNGADVNAKNCSGRTPLGATCLEARLHFRPELSQIAKRLIDHGANLDAVDTAGATPLLEASASNFANDIFAYLWEAGANIKAVGLNGGSILHRTALYGGLRRMQYIRSRRAVGLDPDRLDEDGNSPLGLLVWRQQSRPEDLFPGMRRATSEEVEEFEALLWEIRRRNWEAGLFLYSRELFDQPADSHSDAATIDEDSDSWVTEEDGISDCGEVAEGDVDAAGERTHGGEEQTGGSIADEESASGMEDEDESDNDDNDHDNDHDDGLHEGGIRDTASDASEEVFLDAVEEWLSHNELAS